MLLELFFCSKPVSSENGNNATYIKGYCRNEKKKKNVQCLAQRVQVFGSLSFPLVFWRICTHCIKEINPLSTFDA